MKIRNGFVSNSSSSSFVLAVTRSFKLPKSLKEDLVAEYEDNSYRDEEESLTADEIIAIALDNLCSQKTIWQENAPVAVHVLLDTILRNKELRKRHVIHTIDSGPDDGMYINLLCDGEKEEFIENMKYILESNNEE
jgi:hypothetical protein